MPRQLLIAALCATLLAPLPAAAQDAPSILTVFDRDGNAITTLGGRAVYRWLALSPDGRRLAVVKAEPERRRSNIWVFDIASRRGTQITDHDTWDVEWAVTPVWSPDGSQLAYVGMRAGHEGIYLQSPSGEGAERLLYRHPGAELQLTDWSVDGEYLTFSTSDITGGAMFAVPAAGVGERQAIEVLRTDTTLVGASFSADARHIAYASDESGRREIYVRTFDPENMAEAATWQISTQGGEWALRSGWRQDGRELYYVASDGGIMAVPVTAGATFAFESPRTLFRLSEAVPVRAVGTVSVSRDGERVAIAIPHAPTLQRLTVFDREGRVVRELGTPGRFRNPAISPDGSRVAVQCRMPQTNNLDIWVFDVETGAGHAVTDSFVPEESPAWSPDGTRVAYDSERGLFNGIYHAAADGSGDEQLVFQYTPGAFLGVTDWSADGRFITFQDSCHGVLHVLPLDQDEPIADRPAIEWLRDEYLVAQPRLSPDSRWIAYMTDELEPDEFHVYIGRFDASRPDGGRGLASPVPVSSGAVRGMVAWREDGRELYYLTEDGEVMAVEIATEPTLAAGEPRRLFTLPAEVNGDATFWKSVSRDGKRFVFTIQVAAGIR